MPGGEVIGKTDDRVAVLTLTLKAAGDVPLSVTEVGLTPQVAAGGAPLQLRFTFPLAPTVPLMERLYVAVPPAATVELVLPPCCAPSVKSVPLPLKIMVLCVPEKLIVMSPFAAPATAGAKAMFTMQEEFAAREIPQVLVCVNPALATMLLKFRIELARLVTVTA